MTRPFRLLTAVAFAATALLIASTLSGCTSSASTTFRFRTGTPIGSVYPVKDRVVAGDAGGALLDGGHRTITPSPAGSITVINYWASWCTPCQVETPQFSLLSRSLLGKGVQFVGVNTKDDKSDARGFVNTYGIAFPTVYDEQGKTALDLGDLPQIALPFTVLIDKHDKVAAVFTIRLSDNDLQKSIDILRAER